MPYHIRELKIYTFMENNNNEKIVSNDFALRQSHLFVGAISGYANYL